MTKDEIVEQVLDQAKWAWALGGSTRLHWDDEPLALEWRAVQKKLGGLFLALERTT